MARWEGYGSGDWDFWNCREQKELAPKTVGCIGLGILLESFGYGIQNGGFAGASLTGQPLAEDTRAGR